MKYIIIFFTFLRVIANGQTITYSDLVKNGPEKAKLEDYLAIRERGTMYDIAEVLRSTAIVRKLENKNVENLKGMSAADKIQNIKERIQFISKQLTSVKLSLAEELVYLISLHQYYDEGAKLTPEFDSWISESKADLYGKKKEAFDLMVDGEVQALSNTFKDVKDGKYKNDSEKPDGLGGIPTPKQAEKVLNSLAEIKKAIKNNETCLLNGSCSICKIELSKKDCKKSNGVYLPAATNIKFIAEKYKEGIENFNKRFNLFNVKS
jgi:hypothetical protein